MSGYAVLAEAFLVFLHANSSAVHWYILFTFHARSFITAHGICRRFVYQWASLSELW